MVLSTLRMAVRCKGFLQAAQMARSKLPTNGQIYRFMHSGPAPGVPITGVEARAPTGREITKRLLAFVWPKNNWSIRRRVVIAMAFLITAKTFNAFVPFLLRDVVNYYNDKAPELLKLNLDTGAQTIITTGVALIIAYGVARAGSSLFNELRNAVFAKVAQHSVRNIAKQIFTHLHGLDLSFHLGRQTGALSKAIDRGTRGMSFVMSALVFNIVPTIFEVSLVSGIFYIKCGTDFTMVTAATVATYAAATIGVTLWRTKFRHRMNQADNDASSRAVDSLINYETVKYFTNENFEVARYDHYLRKYEAASLKTSSSLALLNFVQNAIFSTGMIAVMALAARNVANGSMTVGDIVMVNTLLMQLSMPLNFLGSVYREVRQGLQDMQTMFSLLELKSKIIEKPDAEQLITAPGNATVKFEDVVFGYLPNAPILNGLNFEIPTGKKAAIVGGSGSGKSTVVRLLYRLYDTEEGKIKINDEDIRDFTLDSLRKSISVVPQDAVLFHDTLYYNLLYGNTAATKEQVYDVAKMADLHDAILKMPHGYDTMVGERGLKISGGEKQRVAIARAILKDANIIIYDEATSALDALTEEHIMNSLKKAVHGKTSLYIAHRLATIVDADIIYVLENGMVKECGSHSDLLSQPNGKYSELWRSQHRFGWEAERMRKMAQQRAEESDFLNQLEMDKCCGQSGCESKMAACFNLNLDSLHEIDWETKRNHIASVASGFLFFLGIWIYIDTAVVYDKKDWNNAYIMVTIASALGMFMVNAVSNRTVQGISYDEGILGTRGARLWLMIAFVLSFASLVAGLWLMFSDYVLQTGDHTNWPGIALFLNNFLIFCASLVYKFGRLEELWQ
ncbi:unnamed protein product [Bursaphelenchus okinawaensis]|uniref:Iron-sulfur clusters transporter ABCB7, mitochondrial n=1 Tax=Bursaphelenchus okinawaensis TaxID=465554 RepID=A0A811JUB7_9BILA|nr:unnamed protein product [Bursaphelenchus okinawaensis]CAG9083429.1 unnamed protein product [Bursaphelenchus okinawaensis]